MDEKLLCTITTFFVNAICNIMNKKKHTNFVILFEMVCGTAGENNTFEEYITEEHYTNVKDILTSSSNFKELHLQYADMIYSKNMTVRYKGYESPSYFIKSVITSKILRLPGLKYDLKLLAIIKKPFYNIHMDHSLPSNKVIMHDDNEFKHNHYPITFTTCKLVHGKTKHEACKNDIQHNIYIHENMNTSLLDTENQQNAQYFINRLVNCGIDMVGRYNINNHPLQYSIEID